MAKTIRQYTGDGVRTVYPVDFELGYISEEHIYVYTGYHTEFEQQLTYSWVDEYSIELDEPVENGTELYIRRVVPRDAAVNDYEDTAILRESELDDSFLQALMICEELSDGLLDIHGTGEIVQDPSNGNSIVVFDQTYTREVIDGKDAETLADSKQYTDDRVNNSLTYILSLLGRDGVYGSNTVMFQAFGAVIGEDASTAFERVY